MICNWCGNENKTEEITTMCPNCGAREICLKCGKAVEDCRCWLEEGVQS